MNVLVDSLVVSIKLWVHGMKSRSDNDRIRRLKPILPPNSDCFLNHV